MTLSTELVAKALTGSILSIALLAVSADEAAARRHDRDHRGDRPHQSQQRPKPRPEATTPPSAFCRPTPASKPGYIWVCNHWERQKATASRPAPLPGLAGDFASGVLGRPPVGAASRPPVAGGTLLGRPPVVVRDHRAPSRPPVVRDHRSPGTFNIPVPSIPGSSTVRVPVTINLPGPLPAIRVPIPTGIPDIRKWF